MTEEKSFSEVRGPEEIERLDHFLELPVSLNVRSKKLAAATVEQTTISQLNPRNFTKEI